MPRQLSAALPVVIVAALFLSISVLLPVSNSAASAVHLQTPVEAPNEGIFPIDSQKGITLNTGDPIEGDPQKRDAEFYAWRTAHDSTISFTVAEAAELRARAADQLSVELQNRPALPAQGETYGGAWTSVGPNPMILAGRTDGYTVRQRESRRSDRALRCGRRSLVAQPVQFYSNHNISSKVGVHRGVQRA